MPTSFSTPLLFSVRPAVPSDFSPIEELVGRAHQAGELWALSWAPAVVADELARAQVFVAVEEGGALTGFVCVRPPGSGWEITLIAVGADFRGNNVAALLIKAVYEQGQAGKCDASPGEILLEVRDDNLAAIRAYQKSGFEVVGRRPGYYRDGAAAILFKKA